MNSRFTRRKMPALFCLLALSQATVAMDKPPATTPSTVQQAPSLQTIVANTARGDEQQRDQFRHPAQTLDFFELKPEQTVVEIWPGGGWYTAILAPYLSESGRYYAAHFDPKSKMAYFRKSRTIFEKEVEQNPLFINTKLTSFAPPELLNIAPAGSADRVLTFRNIHNWYMGDGGDTNVVIAFKAFFKALKPGGILGVVEHRLPEDRPQADQEESGYMKQSYVIKMAEKAGFKLVETSEINANPKDTADHPQGVWTLPPRLRLGDENRDKYSDIGESDRMTLKFVKPK